MNYWLMKSEPSAFSIEDLQRRPGQIEPWDGVRNYQARNMMRINIGNFPGKSRAALTVNYYQKLVIEDLSYCLRIPVTYIPPYMGDIAGYIHSGQQYKGQAPKQLAEEEKDARMQEVETLIT